MKKSVLMLVIGIAVGLCPQTIKAFTPMSEDTLKATTGQAAEMSDETGTEELLQAYYDLFDPMDDRLPVGADGEGETLASDEQLGDLGIVNWAFQFLNTNQEKNNSLLAAIKMFNASGIAAADQINVVPEPSVIMELPRLVIIAPKASYTIVVSTSEGTDDDKVVGTFSREAALMALRSGTIEIAGH